MPSLIPNFEYDIFISYRHKDNKGDHWVTEFVSALKTELEATFKEDISIYFDSNPIDGLLETHNVDKSLEGKLKCLIFIPIISQTYCDTKSFAWQHEFVAFNRMCNEDAPLSPDSYRDGEGSGLPAGQAGVRSFGRDIKLSNGNVASRILPIKIHDLDAEDKALLENELGGVLRAIEFIFKSTGVNRPLRSNEDHPQDNLNKTFYRDQVNKVANAIKEIVTALKNPGSQPTPTTTTEASGQPTTKPIRNRKTLTASIALLLLLIITGYLLYPKLFPSATESPLDKSIAVLPFQNLSGDPAQEYFSDGIAEEVLNALTQIKDLKVPGRSSSFQFKGKVIDLKEVGEKLKVSTVLEGSVRKQGNRVKITAQLTSVETGYQLWSQQFDRTLDDVFAVQEEIAIAIIQKLKVTLLQNEKLEIGEGLTENQEAYDAYLKGRYFWNRRELKESEQYFALAVKLDTSFASAYAGLAETYSVFSFYNVDSPHSSMPKAQKAAEKAIQLNGSLAAPYAALAFKNFTYDWNPEEAKRYFEKAIQLNPTYAPAHYWYAQLLAAYGSDSSKALGESRRAVELDPLSPVAHNTLGRVYFKFKRFEEALQAFKSAAEFNMRFSYSYFAMGYCYLALGNRAEAQSSFTKASQSSNDRAMSALVYCYVSNGELERAKAIFDQLLDRSKKEYIPKSSLAAAASFLGQKDLAHELLKKAIEERDHTLSRLFIDTIPLPNDLFSDPRNVALFEKYKLPHP